MRIDSIFSVSKEATMAVSLSSSSSSTITRITKHPKLRTIHRLGNVRPGYSVDSHNRKSLTGVSSSRRSTVVVSAITGASGTGTGKDTADLLETVKVLDLRGNEIQISDLWKDRKAVVAFARHFGCVLCRKRAAYLAAKKDVMDASGVTLILIGPGSIDQANSFVEQTKFKGEVYADPNHASYEALGFVSGVSVTFTPKAALKIIESYMDGYRQDWKLSFMKDTVERGGWQQGGILVAGPGKHNISYIRKDKEAGDDPPVEEILEACCA